MNHKLAGLVDSLWSMEDLLDRVQDMRMSRLEQAEAMNRQDAKFAKRRRHPKNRNSRERIWRRQNGAKSMQIDSQRLKPWFPLVPPFPYR
ncbi:MAG: hypothetical protein ACE5KM_15515 [Planctomycetaceae bacterium]